MPTRLRYGCRMMAALFCCIAGLSCENDARKVNDLLKKKTAVEEAIQVTSYMSQEGLMKAKLTSPYMLRYQSDSPYVEFPRTLHVDFYNDSTKIESLLDAHYARFREFEHRVFLKDSVVVINILKGDTLRTDELWWDQNKQEFYTDKKVRIYQRDKTIYGTGLKAAQNFSWYDIFAINGIVMTSGDALQ